MIFDMTGIHEMNESQANILCKSCGLCCRGHLFSWSKLRSAELDSAEALGLNVFRSVPSQRGFAQPCPLWQGECTIYASPHYPHYCRTYKCKLLKHLLDETTSLTDALNIVQEAKGMIGELEVLLPGSTNRSFRERLAAHFEDLESSKAFPKQGNEDVEFRLKARALLDVYEKVFGVKDVVDKSED